MRLRFLFPGERLSAPSKVNLFLRPHRVGNFLAGSEYRCDQGSAKHQGREAGCRDASEPLGQASRALRTGPEQLDDAELELAGLRALS